jgi:hypothetical protein
VGLAVVGTVMDPQVGCLKDGGVLDLSDGQHILEYSAPWG